MVLPGIGTIDPILWWTEAPKRDVEVLFVLKECMTYNEASTNAHHLPMHFQDIPFLFFPSINFFPLLFFLSFSFSIPMHLSLTSSPVSKWHVICTPNIFISSACQFVLCITLSKTTLSTESQLLNETKWWKRHPRETLVNCAIITKKERLTKLLIEL